MIQKIYVPDMTCHSCERRITKKLEEIRGVKVKEISAARCYVKVEYSPKRVKQETIFEAIRDLGYSPTNKNPRIRENFMALGILAGVYGIYLIMKNTIGFDYIPDITQDMSYGLLFIAGFLTSLHCISMCGGIAISQGVSKSRKQGFQNSLLYNLGRILSHSYRWHSGITWFSINSITSI